MLARVPLSLSPEHTLCRFTALPGNWCPQRDYFEAAPGATSQRTVAADMPVTAALPSFFDNPLFRVAHVVASTNCQPKEVMMHVRSLPGKLSEHFCGGIANCRIAVFLCYPGDNRHDRRVVKLS